VWQPTGLSIPASQPEPGAVEQLGHELVRARQGGEHPLDLIPGHDHGQTSWSLGPNGVNGLFQVLMQHVAV